MFFRSTPVKLYVGELAVQPRKDFLRHLEGGAFNGAVLDEALEQRLIEIFPYPRASAVLQPQGNDVAVDVVVEGYSRGGSGELSAPSFYLPFLWRPKVRIGARLYYLKSGKKRASAKVTRRMGWGEYLATLLHWKVYLGITSPASKQRLEELLGQAAAELRLKIENSL